MSPPLRPEPDDREAKARRYDQLRASFPNRPSADLMAQVEREFATQGTPNRNAPGVAADVTATPRPNLPMMAPPSQIGAQGDPQAPFVPLNRLPQPGAFSSLMYGGASMVPYADEAAAALATGSFGGPEYETAHRALEYQQGRAEREHPSAVRMGQTVSTVGQILAMPGLTAEQMAAQGPGRVMARGTAEGALLGGLYASGAADPGLENRLPAFGMGAATGGVFAGGTSALGEMLGGRTGTEQGRRFRDMAEEGGVPLSAARQILQDAPPEYPTAGADLVGSTGPSRLRSIATTPNPEQDATRRFFGNRAGGRPSRVARVFEDAAQDVGINPLARRDALLKQRQEEAQKLFDASLRPKGRVVILPSDKTAPLLRIPRIRQLIDEFREIQNATAAPGTVRKAVQTNAPGLERVTAEELHYVKRRLAELGEGAEPGGAAATQAVGHGANSVQGAVRDILNNVPGYREANAAYERQSRMMAADELGRNALQKRPDEVEYAVDQMTPEEKGFAFRALPSSVNAALETGSARGSLNRLGLGQAPRLGRQRIIDRFTEMSPDLERRLDRLVRAEERGMASEAAAGTVQLNSHTEANRMANLATQAAESGPYPALRRALFSSLRDAPNTAELARDAEVLRSTGDRLRRTVTEAEQATAQRGTVRKGFDLFGKAMAMAMPVADRSIHTAADRSEAQDRYWALRAAGVSEEEALKRAKP